MSLKVCAMCDKEKSIGDFYAKGKTGYLQSYCKTCLCETQILRWINRKIEAIKYKGGKCIKCNYNRNYAAIDFHHRNPEEKDVEWVKLRLKSWDAITAELDKCDLLCRNCHAEIHNPQAFLV